MLTIYTRADEMPDNTRDRPRFSAFQCCDCGAVKMLPAHGYCGASGYAVDRASRELICYPCADTRARAEMLDRTRGFVAYLSGSHVTTWTGGRLGDVIASRPCTLTRRSHWHDSRSYRSVRVRDVHGALWHGRGSDGVAIKLQPMKG